MMKKIISPFLFFSALFAALCFSVNAQASLSSKAATKSQILQQKKIYLTTPQANAAMKVNQVYRDWAGTRYRLGGTSKAGIDCSAFVREAMGRAFNVQLPRSTAEQKHVGRAISRSELRAGDLVFFRNNHHVGVYIGGGQFVHASSSKGVTTSSLNNGYWARNYTQSRRVM